MTRLTKHILKVTTIRLNPIRTVWRYTSDVTINVASPCLGSCRKLCLGSWIINPGRLAFINRAIRQDRPFLPPNRMYSYWSMPDAQIRMAMRGLLPVEPGITVFLLYQDNRRSPTTSGRFNEPKTCHSNSSSSKFYFQQNTTMIQEQRD